MQQEAGLLETVVLRNDGGLRVQIVSIGAAIQRIITPDAEVSGTLAYVSIKPLTVPSYYIRLQRGIELCKLCRHRHAASTVDTAPFILAESAASDSWLIAVPCQGNLGDIVMGFDNPNLYYVSVLLQPSLRFCMLSFEMICTQTSMLMKLCSLFNPARSQLMPGLSEAAFNPLFIKSSRLSKMIP